ncbi:acyl-CoA thioesterase [Nesterenkonia sp. LB17]|uniref:acyl-CoA thioesterase n=1 Tax=unclassified Nesterenkonia TaxID=2629769 RepID=UPI001F4CBA46|nr:MULTISPECIES: acyl-CoA thioesterase [unclassified Nesterenkonia]MCH8560823.1 acyl-CoA thioesterase [Nesterenkonia sp. DZ6]MCH8563568.1 acyl-CoA thioesterase [Nesterenkonia sp. YGD6]MCH8566218.1 acyl-CoA thioesterase [Nesterenkonia sp. LB17]MCH8570903.1 acyl-CoA thioesterase [Nesterenkonia sp. AY15]
MARRSSIELTFREVAGTSPDSFVAAGTVVDWIDKTAYACAASWTRTDCVTSYVGNMHFTVPVPRETPVTVQARVVHTGRTSVHIQTRVLIRKDEGWVVCTECFMIYVAVGDDGEPAAAAAFEPQTELERRRDLDASQRMVYRRQMEETIQSLPEGMGSSEALTMRFLADTDERYPDGKIRGGAVMKWIDKTAEICAERYSGHEVAAVLTGGVRFYRPVTVGDLVEVDARLVLTGSKSMHVLVRVRAGDRREKHPAVVAYGLPVMVAPDGTGSARTIAPWEPITDEDHAVAAQARKLRDLRNATLLTPSPITSQN